MDFVDTLYSFNLIVDVLLFIVEEDSYFTLEGEIYHDQLTNHCYQEHHYNESE
jgi:hypothetical protein